MARLMVGLLATVLFAAACESPVGPATSAADPAGMWTGTVRDDVAGNGTARLELARIGNGNGVVGTYAAVFVGGTTVDGVVSGTLVGGVATIVITPDVPISCDGGITLRGALAATVTVTDDRMTGRYSGFTCGGIRSGRLDLSRQ